MAPSTPAFLRLLVSNEAPDPAQIFSVQEILRNKEAELSDLAAEISKLQSSIKTLQNQRAHLASEIHQYNYIFAPIRRVPPEIIGEIFLLSHSSIALRLPQQHSGATPLEVGAYLQLVEKRRPFAWPAVGCAGF
ncbi:hypothetical protein B0H19DRAFT_167788 [Mycena capillaripes]|nr:hypothetical protein B0H19DRAFT_167788 [Mycena capillaripes]